MGNSGCGLLEAWKGLLRPAKSGPSGQVPWSGGWPRGFSPTFHSGPLFSLFTAYPAFISSEKDEPGCKGDETWFSCHNIIQGETELRLFGLGFIVSVSSY